MPEFSPIFEKSQKAAIAAIKRILGRTIKTRLISNVIHVILPCHALQFREGRSFVLLKERADPVDVAPVAEADEAF
ncbi:hypothetical protein ACHAXS_007970 [Conticribra weissflogii]